MANSLFFSLFSLSLSSYLQFSLPGLTLEMMIFNSTYFSSPFDNSSLFTFPAHLNQEYLQIFFFFQLSISKAKGLLKRRRVSSSNTTLDVPHYSVLPQCLISGFSNTSKSVYHYQSWYHLCIIKPEFCQSLVSKKYFMENKNTQRIRKCQERKLWQWKLTDHLSQIS